jgi:hypothetical protein
LDLTLLHPLSPNDAALTLLTGGGTTLAGNQQLKSFLAPHRLLIAAAEELTHSKTRR